MKVLSLDMQYFKRFRQKHLDFRDPETGLAKDLIVLVGRNGSGKSSVLQAIAAVLGGGHGAHQESSRIEVAGV